MRESECWNVSLGKVKLNKESVGTAVAPKLRTLMNPLEPEVLPTTLLDELSVLEAAGAASPALLKVN